VFGEGDGSDLKVHDTPLGRVGELCCWENILSLNKYAMFSQHEQGHIACWPSFSTYEPFAHALGWETNNAVSKVYAVEGGCFVLGPCAVMSKAMVGELCDTPDKHQLVHVGGGHAVIYGPDGRPLVEKLPEDVEGLLIAELDLGLIGVAKNAMDPVGHYSRPDVHRLLLNKNPGKRVEHMALPLDAVDSNAEATLSAQ
jgi:aliphatic nitrilase